MSQHPVVSVFYSFNEINIKDIESELFTNQKERFHFFFFHNKDLHFKRSFIFSSLLQKKFNTIHPEFYYNPNTKSVRLHKKLSNFDLGDFEKEVDEEYADYLKRINYRVECIFQTFTLFMQLYKDKPLVFVFPIEVYSEFGDIIKKNNLNFAKLNKSDNLLQKFEIFYWIHYYSRKDINEGTDRVISEDNITGYYILNQP